MSFSNTIDAQTQAVTEVISRKSLEIQYAIYNDINDPTKAIRLAIKIQIKDAQEILDSANAYLVSNRISALIYNSSLVNNDNLVSTPWANERDIPNTFLNSLPSGTNIDFNALEETNNSLQNNINIASKNLADQEKKLNDIINTVPDSSPLKTVLLNDAKSSVDISKNVINDLINSKQNVEEIINTSNAKALVPIPLVDTFSESIRKDIHNKLIQKVGYDASQNDDEATVIMRKKALDAFYTAKTPGEKSEALERLNRTAAAMDPNVPITRDTYEFDPLAFSKLHSAIDVVDAELIILSDELAAAKLTNDSVLIEAAQNAFDQKNNEKNNLIDTIKGFRDSPLSIASYPGSHHIAKQSGPEISTPASSETDEVNAHRQLQESQNLSSDTRYYDLKLQKFVDAKDVSATQSGRYINARDVTNADIENYQYQLAISNYKQDYTNKTTILDSSTADARETYENTANDIDQQISQNNQQINDLKIQNDPNNAETISQLVQENSVLQNTKTAAYTTYQTISDQNDVIIKQNSDIYDQQVKNRTDQKDSVISSNKTAGTIDEAKAVTANYQDTKLASDNAQVSFNKSYELAQEHARANGASDPKDPSNWTLEDRDAVGAKQATLQGARQDEAIAATNFNTFSTEVPNGNDLLLQSGLTNADIQKLNENSVIDRNNNGGVQPQTKAGFGNTADSIDATNIRPINGFEGINNSSPFYLQFPTLKAITDFKLRNGISPYGQQTPDEIARNAIHFNIFEITPPAARANLVEGTSGLIRNVVEPAKNNTIGSFTIYPSNQELSMTHSHNYNDDLGLAKVVQQGLDVVNGADTLLTFGAAGIESAAGGKEVSVPQRLQRRIESIDKYQGTEKQVITTEFNLFTKNDFLHDVFRPLMFLTALSYPKRNLTGNLGDDIARGSSALNTLSQKSDFVKTALEVAKKILPNITSEQARNVVNNAEQRLAETGGLGPFRYFITKSPEYISVRHASGLFYLPLAVILGVEYTFEGPWYNYNGDPIETPGNLDQIVRNGLNTNASTRSFQEIFADLNQPTNPFSQEGNSRPGRPGTLSHLSSLNKNDPFIAKYNLPFAYPTSAKCIIRYKSAISQFRDDYLRLFYEAGKPNGGAGIVSVSEEQTGTITNPNFFGDVRETPNPKGF